VLTLPHRRALVTGTSTLFADFRNETLPSWLALSRASSATYINATGTLQTAASGIPRYEYDLSTLLPLGLLLEEQRTNGIRNSNIQGASIGTPGVLPTYSSVPNNNGVTTNVVGLGTANGYSYIDLQIIGTTTGTTYAFSSETMSAIAVSAGQNWSVSGAFAIVGGSTANITAFAHRIRGYTSGGVANDASAGTNILGSLTSTLKRFSESYATGANTAFVTNQILLTTNSAAAVNVTLRIAAPQLELGAFATSFIPTSGTVVTRSADVLSAIGAAALKLASGSYVYERRSQQTGTLARAYNAGALNMPTSFWSTQLALYGVALSSAQQAAKTTVGAALP
jgi:hypothetical protein